MASRPGPFAGEPAPTTVCVQPPMQSSVGAGLPAKRPAQESAQRLPAQRWRNHSRSSGRVTFMLSLRPSTSRGA
ncbi:hypothetical protein C4Q27_17905 [Pseudomonas sp. SWI36]|nr:hypothetical protein C4Q27_17905 [Pseudomonas sp. SWI36]